MGVWVYPNLAKKVDGKVKLIEDEPGVPSGKEIHYLNSLIFDEELKENLVELSANTLDLSFFTEFNSADYGNYENVNVSFSPIKVLQTIEKIESLFKEHEQDIIRSVVCFGMYDNFENQIFSVFTEIESGFWLFKKRKMKKVQVKVNDEDCYLWYFTKKTKTKKIDISIDRPVLYYDKNKMVGDKIDWRIKKERFKELIQPELDNIRELAEYGKKNNLELQITHS